MAKGKREESEENVGREAAEGIVEGANAPGNAVLCISSLLRACMWGGR